MKKFFAVMLVSLLVLVCGCVNDDDDDNKDINSGGGEAVAVQASDYFPLTIGNKWDYTETGIDFGDPFTKKTTATVVGTIQINGKIYSIMEEEADSTFVRIDGALVLTDNYFAAHDENNVDEDDTVNGKIAVAMKAVAKAAVENDELIWFDFNKEVGAGWTMFEDEQELEYGTTSLTVTGKREGTQGVTVPSGTFKNCEAFTITLSIRHHHIPVNEDDKEFEYTYTSTTTYWMAKNVGLVKTKYTVTGEMTGLEPDEEDDGMKYESVTTLDSYDFVE